MGFTYRDHAADLAVRAWGESLGEVFAEAARAITAAMVGLRRVKPIQARRFTLGSNSLSGLLVDWLAALVAEKDTSCLVFSEFDVRVEGDLEGARLEAEVRGEPLDPARHDVGVEVKGISLLGLSVRREGTVWVAEFVADV